MDTAPLTSTLALTSGGGSPTVLNIHTTTPWSSGNARSQSWRFNCRRRSDSQCCRMWHHAWPRDAVDISLMGAPMPSHHLHVQH